MKEKHIVVYCNNTTAAVAVSMAAKIFFTKEIKNDLKKIPEIFVDSKKSLFENSEQIISMLGKEYPEQEKIVFILIQQGLENKIPTVAVKAKYNGLESTYETVPRTSSPFYSDILKPVKEVLRQMKNIM